MDGLQNTFSTRKYYSLVYKYTKAYLNSNSNVRDFSAPIYIYIYIAKLGDKCINRTKILCINIVKNHLSAATIKILKTMKKVSKKHLLDTIFHVKVIPSKHVPVPRQQ